MKPAAGQAWRKNGATLHIIYWSTKGGVWRVKWDGGGEELWQPAKLLWELHGAELAPA